MLLLTVDQVDYCPVISESDGSDGPTIGITYRGKLFSKIDKFSKDEKQVAHQWARRLILENKGKFLVLVVEELEYYTIWQQDNQIQVHEAEPDPLADIDLETLVTQMRNVGGIRIEDRRYKLKQYSRCFVGSEVVAWFMRTLKLSQAQAIDLGQRLVDQKWIHHVADAHPFKDEYLFYRFYWDE
jgi:hypothetical protein